MLNAVLSNSGVEAGSSSSAHRGPSREADCVVAKIGIDKVVPGQGWEVVRVRVQKGRDSKRRGHGLALIAFCAVEML